MSRSRFFRDPEQLRPINKHLHGIVRRACKLHSCYKAYRSKRHPPSPCTPRGFHFDLSKRAADSLTGRAHRLGRPQTCLLRSGMLWLAHAQQDIAFAPDNAPSYVALPPSSSRVHPQSHRSAVPSHAVPVR